MSIEPLDLAAELRRTEAVLLKILNYARTWREYAGCQRVKIEDLCGDLEVECQRVKIEDLCGDLEVECQRLRELAWELEWYSLRLSTAQSREPRAES